jgi:hypothetical protein
LFYNLCNTSITCVQALVLLVPLVLVPLVLVRQALPVRQVPLVRQVRAPVPVLVQELQPRVSSLQASSNQPLQMKMLRSSASQE